VKASLATFRHDGPVIAVIDDDAAFRELMGEVLVEGGYRSVNWPKRAGAVEFVEQAQPALVVVNAWLEGRDRGMTVIRALRASPATASLPILVCTGDQQFAKHSAGWLREQSVALLLKPFELDSLYDVLAELLGGTREM
jgi:CheY-like chemotaxis protein